MPLSAPRADLVGCNGAHIRLPLPTHTRCTYGEQSMHAYLCVCVTRASVILMLQIGYRLSELSDNSFFFQDEHRCRENEAPRDGHQPYSLRIYRILAVARTGFPIQRATNYSTQKVGIHTRTDIHTPPRQVYTYVLIDHVASRCY